MAADAHLSKALCALWPWLLLDDPTMEAVLELLCVYTANFTRGLSVFIFLSLSVSYVFVQALCLARGCPSALSVVTESHTFNTKGPIVQWPLSNIVSYCTGQAPACLVVTMDAVSDCMATGFRPVGDDVGWTEHLCLAWDLVFLHVSEISKSFLSSGKARSHDLCVQWKSV